MKDYSSVKKWLICISIFACGSIATLVSPIVQTLANAFPDVAMSTVRSITTIPSLISFICGLFLATIVGKKIPYKNSILTGMALCLIGGVLPAFWNGKFIYIILSRTLYGMGFAVFAMRNAIITKAFGVEESAKWTGYGYFVGNAFSMSFQLISGRLGDINWHYCFFLYLFCAVAFVIILTLFKEPENVEAPAQSETEKKASKAAISPRILPFFLMMLLGTLCLYPFLSSISTFVAERGFGTATRSSWVSSAYTLGGALFGVNFGRMNKAAGRWVAPIACLSCICGYTSVLLAGNIAPVILGGLLCGGGFSWFMLSVIQWAGGISSEGNRTLHMTIISSAVSGGSFISSYFMAVARKIGSAIPLFETEIEKTFLIGIIIYVVLMILYLVKDFRPQAAK